MRRTRLVVVWLVAAVVTLFVGASVQSVAVASAPRPEPRHADQAKSGTVHPAKVAADQSGARKVPAFASAKPYERYQVVTSPLLVSDANSQSSAVVSCPRGLRVVGGGAAISGSDLKQNINTSFPSTTAQWKVHVSNASSTSGTFTVYAECAKKISRYSIVRSGPVINAAGQQTTAVVACPAKTVVLGGGGIGDATSPLQNLNSSYPLGNGWRVDVNNAWNSDATIAAVAVCGAKPTGYLVVSGDATLLNAFSQGSASVFCPNPRVALSGGAYASSSSTSVNLNTTVPSQTTTWVSYENNDTAMTNVTVRSYAICAEKS